MICELCGAPRRLGDWPICDDGSGKHGHSRPHGGTLLQAIHPMERAVIFRNPQTGEIRTPARNDADMPESYRAAGFERVEVSNHQIRRELEREGHVMEAAYYDNGSGTADRDTERALGPAFDGACVGADDDSNRLTLKDLQDAGLQD